MGDYMKVHLGAIGNFEVKSTISANNITIPRVGEIIITPILHIEMRVTKVTYEYQNTDSVEINVYTEVI